MSVKLERRVSLALTLTFAVAVFPLQEAAAKLIELKPIFDTTYLPKKRGPFQLNVKRTEIVYPGDTTRLLRGTAKTVDLRAEENTNVLRGKVEQEIEQFPITTVERNVKGVFHLDLQALLPKIAPDLSRQLEGRVEDTKRRLAAQLENNRPLLDAELSAPRPAATIPQVPKMAPVPAVPAAPPGPRLASLPAIPTSVPVPSIQSGTTKPVTVPGGGNGAPVKLPGGAGGGMPKMPGGGGFSSGLYPLPIEDLSAKMNKARQVAAKLNANPASISTSTSATITSADKEIEAQLLAAKKRTDAMTDVNARLAAAQKDVSAALKNAQAQLNSIMVNARRLPDSNGSGSVIADEHIGNRTIPWDAWHAKFAKVAGDSILSSVNKAGAPVGENTVSVIVWPNHRVKITLMKKSNARFDAAVLSAYQAIDGNVQLAYPAGSLRQSVTFLVDNKYSGKGNASMVQSRTTSGDKEFQRQITVPPIGR